MITWRISYEIRKTIPIRDKARNGERDAQFRGSDLAPELAALGSALVGATASREWGGGDDGKRMEKRWKKHIDSDVIWS